MFRFSAHYFFYFATFAVVSPYFQALLRARGFDKSEVGTLLGAFCLAGAIGVGPVGALADKLGQRKIVLASVLVISALLIIPLAFTNSFYMAMLLTVVFGISYKSIIPLGDALASSELPDPTTQYGKVRVFGSIGFISALWFMDLTGLIDINSSSSIMKCFLVTAALSLPIMLTLPDSHRRLDKTNTDSAERETLGKLFWVVMVVVFFSQLGMTAMYSFLTLYLKDVFQVEKPGWIWAIGSLAEMPVIFMAGKIIPRLGVTKMLTLALLSMSLRLGIYASSPVFAIVVAAQLLHAGTFGLLHTAVVEFISRTVKKTLRASAMTIYMAIGLGAAQCVGSFLGGHTAEKFGFQKMYALFSVFPIIGIAILLTKRKSITQAVNEAAGLQAK